MKRLLALLVALAIGWLTMPSAASASLIEHGRPLTYTYDLPGYDAPGNDNVQERGPPSVAVVNPTHDAVDLWSHGTLARPDGLKAPWINRAPCGGVTGCGALLPRMVPRGSTLTINVVPNGSAGSIAETLVIRGVG